MTVSPLVVAGAPLVLSLLGCAALVRFAPQLGLVDKPDPTRKIHARTTPLGGGLAFALPLFLLAWLVAPLAPSLVQGLPYPDPADARWFLGLGLVLLGLFDDLRPLPWPVRLGAHLAAAGVAVFFCLPPLDLGWRLLAALWIAAMINAFNMLDNMDALSGGVAFSALLWIVLIFLFLSPERPPELAPCLTLLAGLAGFLWFNQPPARLFMGDAGSTFLGFFVGLTSVQAAIRPNGPSVPWLLPPCLCAAACYDMLTVVSLRLYQGRSPFKADKQHLSHRLVQLGLSRPAAVFVIVLMALVSGLCAAVVYAAPPWLSWLTAALLACGWLLLLALELGAKRPAMSEEKPQAARGEKGGRHVTP
jgi:UDP-GlcNAc:undecaprenyl-phosphate GlcNAc-1-phosphate transferase